MTEPADRLGELSPDKRALLEELLRKRRAPAVRSAASIPAASRGDDPLPLSFAQQRLWFLHQFAPDSPVYNIPVFLEAEGAVEPRVLARVLSEVVRRHEVLRTGFEEVRGQTAQRIGPPVGIAVPVVDLAGLSAQEREPEARRLAAEEAVRPFRLDREPVLRSSLLRLGRERWLVLLTMHHIASDAWSTGVLVREVSAIYPALAQGLPPSLPSLAIQYADYAVWQRQQLSGDLLEAELAHWRARLTGAPAVLGLPLDRPRPPAPPPRGAARDAVLARPLSEALRALARGEGATLFMVLLTGLQILLGRTAGQEDVCVGTPVAGRSRMETEPLIGFFVNTLVLRLDLSGAPSFRELLVRTREATVDAFVHQELPFEKLVETLAPERSLSYSPLFQAMLVLQNAPLKALDLPGLRLEPFVSPPPPIEVDWVLTLADSPDGMEGAFQYRPDLFDATTVERALAHLLRLLEEGSADPDRRIRELPWLAEAEAHQLLHEWSGAEPASPEALIQDLIAAQARRAPEAPAVVYPGGVLTYGELTRRSGRLAHRLRALGAEPETRVAVFFERSPEMLVALLGVIEAGAAYVPLDPAYPEERLSWMVEDSGALLVLTTGTLAALAAKTPAGAARTVCLEDLEDAGGLELAPLQGPLPESPAYVIYTSGSTGRPKGAVISHRSLVGYTRTAIEVFRLEPRDRVLQFAALSFDVAVEEIFPTLAAGAAIVLRDPLEIAAGEGLLRALKEDAVSVVELPTAFWNEWVHDLSRAGEVTAALPPSLRLVLVGGDLALPERLAAWRGSGVPLINVYGLTEVTVTSIVYELGSSDRDVLGLPIGRPMSGHRAFLLDASLRPVPAGVAGELYLGGACLARCYLGRPDLTAERLVPDPHACEPGLRLYRTGDLARFFADGNLEFLGRVDHQVKVRGFRVELGEIEAALAADPVVREVAVTAWRYAPGDRRLVAYVALAGTPEGERGGVVRALRNGLQERLPAYMTPSYFVVLDALPRTSTGKVDRRALPAPQAAQDEPAAVPGRSLTPSEQVLAAIWSEVLGIERPRLDDHFFELGGHSLLATQLASRVRAAFGVELPLRTFFERPVLADLAAAIEALARGGGQQAPLITPVPRERFEGALPLSFAQERLWFIDRLDPGSPAYNLPFAVRLTGALDRAALAAALAGVTARHEALRTTFAPSPSRPGQAVQRIAPPPQEIPPLAWIDLAALPDPQIEAGRLAVEEAARPFDLEHGPLLRCSLVRLAAGAAEEHLALFTLHHIVADGWSMGVLTRELGALYGAAVLARPAALPALRVLPVQYADFAVWQRDWLRGEVLEAQLAYWREKLAGAPPSVELPLDRPRPPVRSFRGASLPWQLPSAVGEGVRALCRREGATSFMVLLAGFAALLGRWAGQEDVVIGTPVANRNRSETEGLIGFFVNTLALRVDLSGEPSSAALVRRNREAALGAYAHQDVPFEALVEAVQPERDLSRSPLFQVLLSLENVPDAALDLPGLLLRPVPVEGRTAKFDLSLILAETGDGFGGGFDLSTDLFDAPTVARLGNHLVHLLEGMTSDPSVPVVDLPLLSAPELHQLRLEWNDTAREEPRDLCLHERFAEHAARAPEAPALEFDGRVISYRELADRAGRVARRLPSLGVGPGATVAVCAERSPGLVAAFLGILEAGGAYVPLDPAHPQDRLAWVIGDSGASVVLAGEPWIERLASATQALVVPLEGGREDESAALGAALLPHPDQLAYVLYTSGSTGRPKGVGVSHRAVGRMASHSGLVRLDASDRVGMVANPAFDASTGEIWGALLHGGCLVGIERETVLSPAALAARFVADRITFVLFTTALFHQIAREAPRAFGGFRYVLMGGEAVDPRWIKAVLESGAPPENLVHAYGPTEATVYVTAHVARRIPDNASSVPIGRPIDHVRVRVLDARLRPAPIGVAGDLHVGGPNLARGYVGRPDLTAERFVPDPDGSGDRLYRTGDRVRHLPNGELEFLGRRDLQVKIRGLRIELGEIEAALGEHPAVAQAAVLVRHEPSGARLVAFAASRSEPLEPAELRRALERRLPAFMVPSAFAVLPSLPLTANGKVDRAALARLDPEPEGGTAGFVAPRTPVEELLAGIWAEVLGLDPARRRIGAGDNFFDLSGHSLLATQVASRVQEAFGVDLPLRRLFERATLAELADEIEAASATAVSLPAIEAIPKGEPVPASFYQEWGCRLQKALPGVNISIPLAARLRRRFDLVTLRQVLTEIARRHGSLRTTFYEMDGEVFQRIAPAAEVPVPVVDLGALPEAWRPAAAQELVAQNAAHSFDLERGPLLAARVLRLGPEDHVLLFNIHHLVSDGWSIQIFQRELSVLYAAFAAGKPSPLPELPRQFADFAWWQRRIYTREALPAQLDWWRTYLAGLPPIPEIPSDRPRPAELGPRGVAFPMALGPELTRGLRALAGSCGCSVSMALTAGIQSLLWRYTGCEDQLLNAAFAGRNRPELAGVIGLFMNTVVLRTDLSGGPGFREILRRVRESVLAAYAHQETPFPQLLEALFPGRRIHRAMLSRAILNMLSFSEGPPDGAAPAASPGGFEPMGTEDRTAKQDLLFTCYEDAGNLYCTVQGAADLFEPRSVEHIAGDFAEILARAVADPETPLDRLLPAPRLSLESAR